MLVNNKGLLCVVLSLMVLFFFQVLKSKSQVHRKHAVSAQAAFRSQTQREIMPVRDSSKRPAPCKFHSRSSCAEIRYMGGGGGGGGG